MSDRGMVFSSRAASSDVVQADEIEFRRDSDMAALAERYWQVARTNKLLAAAIIAGSLLIGILATLLATPMYRASSTVEINRLKDNVTNLQGATSEDVLRDRQYFETQTELLQSRSLADRIVRELNLGQNEAFLGAFDVRLGSAAKAEDALSPILLSNVDVDPVNASALIEIRFTSPDPAISAQIANAWAEQFIASNLDRRFGASLEARKFLEDRLEQLRQRLETAERDLINYGAANDLFTIQATRDGGSGETASQTLVAIDLQALNAELAAATAARISAQSELDAPSGSLNEADQAAAAPLRQRRAELATQRAELATRLGPEFPQIKALSAQIEQLDREIANEQARTAGNVGARYRQALSRERRLRDRVSALRDEFVRQRRSSVQYNILQRDVDTNRELYSALLQRYREIGVAGVGENNVSIVDAARPPSRPFKPNLSSNLFFSFLIGVGVAIAMIITKEQLNQSLRDPNEVTEKLGLPLLATIPRTKVDDLEHSIAGNSDFYEAYLSLFSAIWINDRGGFPKSLMVTSSRPGEGKSVSAITLARVAARQGRKVLLLDADLRHSGIKRYLTLRSSEGLSQLLHGESDWQSMLQEVEALGGFQVLSAGRKSAMAAELLSGGRFSGLLDELERSFDIVIVDGPPVLGLADAPLISNPVDAVLLVIEANEGKLRHVENALDRLGRSQANIIGAAVTKVDDRNAAYGYGAGYGYSYAERDDEAVE